MKTNKGQEPSSPTDKSESGGSDVEQGEPQGGEPVAEPEDGVAREIPEPICIPISITVSEEEKATGLYQPVVASEEPDEKKATGQYHQTVASLLSKLTQPEVAAITPDQLEFREAMVKLADELQHVSDHLSANQDEKGPQRREAVKNAEQCRAKVAERMDELQQEAELKQYKDEWSGLVAAYFKLDQLLKAARDAGAEASIKVEKAKTTKARSPSPRSAARPADPGRRRVLFIGVTFGLVALGVGAFHLLNMLQAGSGPAEQISGPGSIETVNHHAGSGPDDAPAVLSVVLAKEEDGALVADAVVVDSGDCSLEISYRWFENERRHSIDDRRLPADQIVSKATYRVVARARCGDTVSGPLSSGSLEVP